MITLCDYSIAPAGPTPERMPDLPFLNRAWRDSMGENVFVAMLDTGCDCLHPDLEAGIHCPWPDGVETDEVGHGTHVAGIIGARSNGFGACGVAPECFLVPMKCVPGPWEPIGDALTEAIGRGVDVINCSFGSPDPPPDFITVLLAKAYQTGILVVASAGNAGAGDDTITYPARCANVVPVAAVTDIDAEAPFSSTGDELQRGFCAVGVDVYSTWPGNHYALLSGTSMAAPAISGIAALIIAKHRRDQGSTPIPLKGPGRVDAIIQHLEYAATQCGDPKVFGHGYIDAARI